jgi:hypothetical protein
MTLPPPLDEQSLNGPDQKRWGAERWTFAVAVLILSGLLGHLMYQAPTSRQTSNVGVESASAAGARETAPATPGPKTQAAQQSPMPRNRRVPKNARPVVYTVTHKHRLRDCHGTLTFTPDGLRFESNESRDSFAVGLDDVTIDGDTLRIHTKTWRFEFDSGVTAQRVYQDWRNGTAGLSAVTSGTH